MTAPFSWAKMARVIAFALFITVPSMAVAGYAVYALRNWLAESINFQVPDLIYSLVLIVAVWAALWLSSGRLISEFRQSGTSRKSGE